jgi:hypothetical protein
VVRRAFSAYDSLEPTIGFAAAACGAGDETGGTGWRLCGEHVDERSAIAETFHGEEGECVVGWPTLPPVRGVAARP